MSTITIPLRDKSYYTGTKTLDGYNYRFTIWWNERTEKWYFNLKGINNPNVEHNGIAMLPGRDMLQDFGHAELGQLWVIDNSNEDKPENPTYDDMGTRWTLEYTTVS